MAQKTKIKIKLNLYLKKSQHEQLVIYWNKVLIKSKLLSDLTPKECKQKGIEARFKNAANMSLLADTPYGTPSTARSDLSTQGLIPEHHWVGPES